MDSGAEKVYVCIGSDPQDGYATLEWALRNWSSHSISIVILHAPAATNSSKDYVYTPFGKLPASYVNEEKLEFLRKMKERENDKLLSQYKAFCGKVKAEVLTIDKYDKPLHKHLVELISELRITKLVMGIPFVKSSSTRKSRAAISGSFYVHRHKPEFCELFIIRGGKLVFLRGENNEGFIEDDGGATVARFKEKGIFRGWLGRMLPETSTGEKDLASSPRLSPSTSKASPDQWEGHVQEIESYFHQLKSSNSDEECSEMDRNGTLWNSQDEPSMAEDMSATEKIEAWKVKIREAHDAIELNRRDAQANVERHARAEWAICLCTRRGEELEGCINKEIATRVDAKKELDAVKEEVCEIVSEVEEKKSKLKSMLELQHELSNKLQLSSLSKSRAESQLHQAVSSRAEMVREIEELRRQRDVLQRRIEFCKEKDAIGLATRMSDLSFNYKEFTADEIRAATDNFSERLRLKSAGDWTNVYRGRINHTTVAIKLYINSHNGPSQEAFQLKVKVLGQIRHPYLLAMIGSCSDLKCIVFEFMHNGCLRDLLFSARRRTRNRALNWHARIRIAAQVSSGLAFLHSSRPRPITHGNLNPAEILVDRNLVAKIHGFRAGWCRDQFDLLSDIRAFGNLVLQVLTGRNWAGLVEESIVTDRSALIEVLDELAGEWPLEMAVELVRIAIRCLYSNKGLEKDMTMETVAREIDEVRKKADDLAEVEEEREGSIDGGEAANMDDSIDVPRAFLCPIFQEVMKNPHVAADGYSYELEAMEEWLRSGQDRSPMTNLKLNHKLLTPNHTLRCLIHDWRCKTSCIPPT